MNICKLESEIIAKIRSSATINSISQCITELVLNSLDAKSTAIAIRINLITFKIQVVDNGNGFSKKNLKLTGQRYMTNKCSSLHQLETQVGYYGFRGEALANIINISRVVEITSKPKNSSETWQKIFEKDTTANTVNASKDRPSCGTTVTVQDILYNLPLRKKLVVPEVELHNIKKNIECLIIIQPHVSFSLRNDLTGDLILNSQKCKNIASSFMTLYPELNDDYSLIKVTKSKVTVKGLIFKQMCENNSMQYVYVNKRPIKCSKLQVFISQILQKKNKKHSNEAFCKHPLLDEKNKHYAYVINIKCPCSFVDILLSPAKTVVEFKSWDIIFHCIEKLVNSFLGNDKASRKKKTLGNRFLVKSDCGVSEINGAFKSYGFKRRKNSETEELTPTKVQKLEDNTNVNVRNSDIPFDNYLKNVENCGEKPSNHQLVENIQSQYQSKKDTSKQIINVSKNTNDISDFSYKGNACDKKQNAIIAEITINDNIDNIRNITKPEPVKCKAKKNVHPLPIKVFNKNTNNRSRNFLLKPQKTIIEKNDNNIGTKACTELNVHELLSENSAVTKFTNDENKGKNLIMDMFLKSTQVYNSDDENQSNRSENTILEMESTYFLENNVTENINGKCKTMSVSVNITKRIKTKSKRSKKGFAVPKAVQTSLDKNKVITESRVPMYNDIDCNNYINETKLAENCTVVLTNEVPYFRFINSDFNPLFEQETVVDGSNCKCNCHKDSNKLFNINYFKNANVFRHNNNIRNNNFNLNFHISSPNNTFHGQRTYKTRPTQYKGTDRENNFNKHILGIPSKIQNQSVFKKFHHEYLNPQLCTYSPYFFNPHDRKGIEQKLNYNFQRNKFLNVPLNRQYPLFNPICDGIRKENFYNLECNNKRLKPNEKKHIEITEDYPAFNCLSKFFTPEDSNKFVANVSHLNSLHGLIRHQSNKREYTPLHPGLNKVLQFTLRKNNQQEDDTAKECNSIFCNMSSDRKPKSKTDLEENLFITLSDQQKQGILEKDLDIEKNFNKINLDWESQMAIYEENENLQQYELEVGHEWIKKQNNLGNNFYVNKRTGFSTFFTPKPITNNFEICKRLDFVPKGLSPILKEIKQIDQSLSQNKKDKLEAYILESHQNELDMIKWQNFIKNNDPKTFFNEVYREKLNLFENCIPRISLNNKKILQMSYAISFDKTLFNNISIIGPVDKKFIAVLEETKQLVILFDQHAVHERIRLEHLLEEYSNEKVSLHGKKFVIFLSYNDLTILKKHEQYLNYLGLYVEFFENGLNILEIPLCIYNKFRDNVVSNSLSRVLQLLIKEVIDLIKETGGVTFKTFPQIIRNIINLEACRGAIKFGDNITKSDCEQLLNKLSTCKLPFQCAHGRPTLTPLISLDSTRKIVTQKLNLGNLLC